jgi:hypothetical protein
MESWSDFSRENVLSDFTLSHTQRKIIPEYSNTKGVTPPKNFLITDNNGYNRFLTFNAVLFNIPNSCSGQSFFLKI